MRSLLAPGLLLALAATLLAPGLVAAGHLAERGRLRPLYVVPVAALAACLTGYAAFGVWLVSSGLGQALSGLILLGGAGCAAWLVARRSWRGLLLNLDVWAPFALLVAVTLFFVGASRACRVDGSVCLSYGYPPDNVLPQWFAGNVAAGRPLTLIGDWHGSDRPPLQSGVTLAFGLLTQDGRVGDITYQLLGTLLQCSWVVAVWVAGRRLNLTGPRLAALLAFCVFSGFFYFNSFYVWPKLLAGSLAMFAVLLLFTEPPGRTTWMLAAAFAACGLLAHTGVAFALIPMAVLLLARRRYRPPLRLLTETALVGVALLAPWLFYQNVVDPPANRLVKWHLAGVIAIDDRTFGRALWDQYTQTPVATLIANRIDNLRTILVAVPIEAPNRLTDGFFYDFGGATTLLRAFEFRYTTLALGLLNLGLLALLVPAARRRLRALAVDSRMLGLLLGGGLLGLLVWVLMMFDGGSALIHQGSYLTMIMLYVSLGTGLVTQPWWIVAPVLGLQVAYFGWLWVVDPLTIGSVDALWLTWAVVGLVAVGAVLLGIARYAEPPDPDPESGGWVRTAVAGTS